MHVHYDITGPWGLIMEACLVGIILGYFLIGWQFWTARAEAMREAVLRQSGAKAAVTKLMVTFIFCALSGYLPRLVPFPDALLIAVHIVLVTATWSYALTRQAVIIATALNRAP